MRRHPPFGRSPTCGLWSTNRARRTVVSPGGSPGFFNIISVASRSRRRLGGGRDALGAGGAKRGDGGGGFRLANGWERERRCPDGIWIKRRSNLPAVASCAIATVSDGVALGTVATARNGYLRRPGNGFSRGERGERGGGGGR